MGGHHDEGCFAGVGDLEIFWQCWVPDAPPRAIVLLSHGAAEHSGRYGWVAEQLLGHGYVVYAVDHRGHGKSRGPRAYVDRLDHAVIDLHAASDFARDRHPGLPEFLLGHSMGGLIALAYACRHQDELAGLVLSAPLAVLEANAATRLASRVLSRVAPRLRVYKIDSTTVSRDPEVVRAYDADPLNYRGALPARTVAELAAAIGDLPARMRSLELPILTLYGTGDRLVDTRASAFVESGCGSEDCTVFSYDGLYHEILNEPEREQVLSDVAGWLEQRVPASAAAR
jgi:acylglycerol lipase